MSLNVTLKGVILVLGRFTQNRTGESPAGAIRRHDQAGAIPGFDSWADRNVFVVTMKDRSSPVFCIWCVMVIDHTHPAYIRKWCSSGVNQFNGAYYYSQEIVKNIIPNVETNRNWITVNVKGIGCDHAIVFIHNNLHPENYEWLKFYGYKDIVLVCGVPETVEKVSHLGKAIYLPISVDVDYVKQFQVEEKTKGAAFVGRPSKKKYGELPDGIDYLEGLPRDELLKRMAEYKTVYAVGRCAIEAKILGCKLKAYDERFPKVSRWKVLDNLEAAKILQEELDKIDGVDHG